MNSAKIDRIVSEFDTAEQAAEHDRWLRKKVAAALADPSPNVPHDEVMAEVTKILESRRKGC